MKLSDFDYYLPEELIAQYPAEKRDESKMMVVYRNTGGILHRHFKDLLDFLDEKYLIVYNDSRVVPCRAFGLKKDTGGKFEVFFLKEIGNNVWECMVKPKKRARIGTKIVFGENLPPHQITDTVLEENKENNPSAANGIQNTNSKIWCGGVEGDVVGFTDDGMVKIKFPQNIKIEDFLNKFGHMPLPPYIKRDYLAKNDENFDRERYQTVFADKNGSIAAPTAGLHFTESILTKLKEKHIDFAPVTLHVGLGTFLPLREEEIENTKLHYEHFAINQNTADKINNAKKQGKKILTIGTTATRVLETQGTQNGTITANEGETNLFMYPGKKFNIVDSLLTNFHLPKSSLFLLVSALAGTELMENAYNEAVKNKYRFFSYGDCMLILDK